MIALKTHGISLDDLVPLDGLCDLVNLVRYTFRRGTTVRYVVLDSKVIIGSSGIVAGSEQDAAVRLVFANDIGCRRRRKNRILSNDELLHTVCRPDLQDSLNGLRGEITTITSDDERRTLGLDGVEYSLNKILGVMLTMTPSSIRIIVVEYRVPPAGIP